MTNFEVNFNDIMSDVELIAEARAAAQKEEFEPKESDTE